MGIRGNRRLSVFSGAGGALSSLWGIVTATKGVVTASTGAGAVWSFVVNTPDAIPWILSAICIAIFAWTFFPRKSEPGEQEPVPTPIAPVASGRAAAAVGVNTGTINTGTISNVHNYPAPAPPQPSALGYGATGGGFTSTASSLSNEFQPPPISPTRMIPLAPTRDVSLGEAVAYVVRGLWGQDFSSIPNDDDGALAMGLVRERALSGDVIIWGKDSNTGLFRNIPATAWLQYKIDWVAGRTRTVIIAGPENAVVFSDLMANKAEFEKAWPHAK